MRRFEPLSLVLLFALLPVQQARAEPLDDVVTASTQGVFDGPVNLLRDPSRISRELDAFCAAGAPLDWSTPGVSLMGSSRFDTLAVVAALSIEGSGASSQSTSTTEDPQFIGDLNSASSLWTPRYGVGVSTDTGAVVLGGSVRGRWTRASATLAGDPSNPAQGANGLSELTLVDGDDEPVSVTTTAADGGVLAVERVTVLALGAAVPKGDARPWGGLELTEAISAERVDYTASVVFEDLVNDETTESSGQVTGLSTLDLFGMENTRLLGGRVHGGVDLGGSPKDPDWRIHGGVGVGTVGAAEEGWESTRTLDGDSDSTSYTIDAAEGSLVTVDARVLGRAGGPKKGRLRYGVDVDFARVRQYIEASRTDPGDTDTGGTTDTGTARSVTGQGTFASGIVTDDGVEVITNGLLIGIPVAGELPLSDSFTVRGSVQGWWGRQGLAQNTVTETSSVDSSSASSSFGLDAGLGVSWVSPKGVGAHLAWLPAGGTSGVQLSRGAVWIAWHPGMEG